MIAFLFTLAIFAFWTLVGFAVISVFNPRLRVLQGILVSPALGIAGTILPVFFINRLGIPVKEFGTILLPALALTAVVVLTINRPIFPVKRLLPYLVILVVALALVAHPMFSYGFDWLSVGNDDMANYSLGAQRFLNHGFFDQPNYDDLVSGKDYSLTYWFMHVAAGIRPGSELMIAVFWAFSGLNALQVFMPVIMALHLALIAGVGGMVSGIGNKKQTPLIAMALLALSPLSTLGALYQLIGQVGGLTLLTGAVALLYRPVPHSQSVFCLVRSAVPAALIFSSLFVWYPEVLPFFGLGWVLYLAVQIKFKDTKKVSIVLPALIVGVLVLLALNSYVITALMFILDQTSFGMRSANLSSILFPYFLVPSGIAAFWGLIPFSDDVREPFVSLAIAGGLILFFWLMYYVTTKQIRRADAPISMLIVMLGLGVLLFYQNNDFGLFKLAMFAQPFLVGVVSNELGRMSWRCRSTYATIALSIVLISMAISQYIYVDKSRYEGFSGFNEFTFGPASSLNRQFEELIKGISTDTKAAPTLMLDTTNIVLSKFQALYANGIKTLFPSRAFYNNILAMPHKPEYIKLTKLTNQYQLNSINGNEFESIKPVLYDNNNILYIYTLTGRDIFNSYTANSKDSNYFTFNTAPVNRLEFIHSKLGNHYYLGDRSSTAFYQLENDPLFPGRVFSSLGRHLLFQAINPSEQVRIVMELTSTIAKQFESELPHPRIENEVINFVGRGTGRIFSEPMELTNIDSKLYVSIDLGRDGKHLPSERKGLMLLYGREIPADQRLMTTWARDISLISEKQYQSISPPISLQHFPADLADKNLEYSGIYEDGWISESSFFVLSPSTSSKYIKVVGTVPQIKDVNFSTVLKLSLDGKEITSQNLGLGNFEVKVPITSFTPKQRVALVFSNYQTLPSPDGRIIGGKIDFIGFE